MVLSLPDGKTKTIALSQDVARRYWFGICPVSSKLGNLKMCGGCKWVGYVGKEEQKEHWPKHKQLCKILKSFDVRCLLKPSLGHIFRICYFTIRIKMY